MDRRTLLGLSVAGTGLLAGCSALGDVLGGTGSGDGAGGGAADAASDDAAVADGNATAAPSLPYRADDPADNVDWARGVGVVNERAKSIYATVVVEDGDRTLYEASGPVGINENWIHDELVLRRGVYRLLVETADGERAIHGMTVGPEWGNVVVRVDDDGIETRQMGVCAPACPPVSVGGEGASLPDPDRFDAGQEVAGLVVVENERTETAAVDVVVDRGESRMVDYRYDVPAGVAVVVPAADRDGAYDLRVTSGGSTLSADWHVPEEPFPRLTVGPNGVTPACESEEVRLTTVENSDERSHAVRATVWADGRRVGERRVDLLSGGVGSLGLSTGGDRITVDLSVDGTRSLSATWSVCPPGPLRVVVLPGVVALRNDSRVVQSGSIE